MKMWNAVDALNREQDEKAAATAGGTQNKLQEETR
jgi:hypothetical protein